MPQPHVPRRGSLQYWHRKRANRPYARIRSWIDSSELQLLGFAGYKAGMTHVMINDDLPTSMTKGENISCPVTIIECPPMKVISIRFYQKTYYGLKLISEMFNTKYSKDITRKLKPSKKHGKEPETFDEIRIAAATQPGMTYIGKKKPDVFEIGIGGSNNQERLNLARQLLDKDIKIGDIFKEGQFVDVHAITKGKGFQGTVKRFGVRIRQHKAEKTKRGIGTLGSWTPKKVSWTVPHSGKMGYHQRTEFNKLLLKLSASPEEVNQKGGILHYGPIKNDFALIKGSLPGPAKRLIILTKPKRQTKADKRYQLSYISRESKQ